ncbi:rhodanese-like domain-containing protein [Azospirillum picis]|uniref:Rhodanese-related sulfurtransferase n=1 Tax=Azospirillum picis TaxID=488438 RepID=A0ABU0MP92_9PROT|nr:rhodanese-like domain-containing protein [Azospirillum picis]MBP2301453.1 rhodanese-related sulfurtransferase [Azospirillum picis]MDQ0535285.1 rhodanese-related sulfurtransferase [Azospirillum picis]
MFLCTLVRRLFPAARSADGVPRDRSAEPAGDAAAGPGNGNGASVRQVDAETVMGWAAAGEAVIVDVREPQEHAAGHVPGAVLNPLSSFDPARVPVEPGKHLVFHCQGGMRCGPAAERMMAAGFTGTINRLRGGFAAWSRAGGAVEH